MSFLENYKFLMKPPLIIEEKDLTKEPNFKRYKSKIDPELLKVDINEETLEQGKVIFPVLRNQLILPLQIGAKYADYEVRKFGGGLIEFEQLYGKELPNPTNEQFSKDFKTEKKPVLFQFYYDDKKERYVHCKSEEKWNELLDKINEHKDSDDVQEIFEKYYDNYAENYILQPGYHLPNQFTYKELYQFCKLIAQHMVLNKDFHDLLYVFGHVDEDLYIELKKQRVYINKHIKKALEFIKQKHAHELDSPYIAKKSFIIPEKEEGTYKYVQEAVSLFMTPGYILDRVNDTFTPTIGEVFYILQLKSNHENKRSREIWLQEKMASHKENGKNNKVMVVREKGALPKPVVFE